MQLNIDGRWVKADINGVTHDRVSYLLHNRFTRPLLQLFVLIELLP